jgi:1-acyl-sn-glycerol-3-phosphate acyltransferase
MDNIHTVNLQILRDIQPPYLLVPNHVNLFDPFFMSLYSPKPVYFIAEDAIFRNRAAAFFVRKFGGIPINRRSSDLKTIKYILKTVRRGNILCLYTEGQQTWDGTTLPLIDTSAKLVKLLKIPVIRVLTKGAFSTRPRWAKNRRRGCIILDFKQIATGEEIKKMSVEVIQEKLTRELAYNEWEWLAKRDIRFDNYRGTEGMKKALFFCPQCMAMDSMRGFMHYFYCPRCGYGVWYTGSGLFKNRRRTVLFDNMHDWNLWQQEYLKKYLGKKISRKDNLPILSNRVTLSTGCHTNPMKRYTCGFLHLYWDRLLFLPDSSRFPRLIFSFEDISALSFLPEHFEFYANQVLYYFKFLTTAASSLKWTSALTYMVEIMNERDNSEGYLKAETNGTVVQG